MWRTRTVDITPDVSLLKKAGEVNYKIPDAVGELVDNPLDEREPGQKLTIEVIVGQRRRREVPRRSRTTHEA